MLVPRDVEPLPSAIYAALHLVHTVIRLFASIWPETCQSPVSHQLKIKSETTAHAKKLSQIHPKQTTQWRKNGEVKHHVAHGLTVSFWHVFFFFYFVVKSAAGGGKPNALPVSCLKGRGGALGVLTSTAQHRETRSSQQDVVNVSSSVGTRGSSTVRSDSSQEEKQQNNASHQEVSS